MKQQPIRTNYDLLRMIKRSFSDKTVILAAGQGLQVAETLLRLIESYAPSIRADLVEIPSYHPVLRNKPQNFTAFETYWNGFRCFVSGLYPDQARNNGIKHIYVEPSLERSSRVLDQYALEQSVNSGVIWHESVGGGFKGVVTTKVCLEEGRHAVEMSAWGKADKKHFAVYSYRNYSEVWDTSEMDRQEILLTISSQEDFSSFDQHVRHIKKSGLMLELDSKVLLKDECMWRGPSECTFTEGIRVSFKIDEKFFGTPVCYDASKGNSKPLSEKERTKVLQEAFIQRNCAGCSVRDTCSKCVTFLEDSIIQQFFCELRRNNRYVSEYIAVKNIMKAFIYSFGGKTQRDEQLMFTTPDRTHWVRLQGNEHHYISRRFLIFEFRQQQYVYNKDALKYFRINRLAAVLLEAFHFTDNIVDVQRWICGDYPIDRDTLVRILDELNKKLQLSLPIYMS
ncbi:hypothetical protein [Paenibacillus sambharensis]|nr:hypothetical protein [Paenibacillus sambharensis]